MAVRRNRGGRGVPGPGRPAAYALRACWAGALGAGRHLLRPGVFTNILPALGSHTSDALNKLQDWQAWSVAAGS